jgi:hypothetical protein
MAQTTSNAPFVSTQNYPDAAGISNSPFTDQRAVVAGGGGGGLGNVIYNGQNLSVDNGAGPSTITSIDNTIAPLTIQNAGGGLVFNASQDTATLRGDNLLALNSTLGNVNITATDNVEITAFTDIIIDAVGDLKGSCEGTLELNSTLGNVDITAADNVEITAFADIIIEASGDIIGSCAGTVKITAGDNIEIEAFADIIGSCAGTVEFSSTSINTTEEIKIRLKNDETTETDNFIESKVKFTENNVPIETIVTQTSKTLIYENFDLFTFAKRTTLSNISPIFAFRKDSNGDPQYWTFVNTPQVGFSLKCGTGDGQLSTPYNLQWEADGGITDNVTFAADPTIVDGVSFKTGGTTISSFFVGPSGSNTSTQRSSISGGNGDLLLKSESTGINDQSRVILEADRSTDGNSDKTAITLTSFLGGAQAAGRDQIEILIGQTSITPIATILNPNFPTSLFPYFSVIESFLAGAGTTKREDTFQISNLQVCKRYENFGYHLYAFGLNSGAISNASQPVFGYNYRGGTAANRFDQMLYRYVNVPNAGEVLSCSGGVGTEADPFNLEFVSAGGGGNLNSLSIDYVSENSILQLSDPVDGIISTTTIVPGRTILIEDITISGTSEVSAIGLSNSVFPPPLQGQTGYFAGLLGNSPPRVSLNPTTGLTNWFPGASFRAIIAGTVNNLDFLNDAVCRVYSNRGQSSQNILNTFTNNFTSVSGSDGLGWKWTVNFTCRSVNSGGVLGVLATNSEFSYTDSDFLSESYGFCVSNVNSSFDTSVEQFLDFTIDFVQNQNELTTNLCTIERIF